MYSATLSEMTFSLFNKLSRKRIFTIDGGQFLANCILQQAKEYITKEKFNVLENMPKYFFLSISSRKEMNAT